MITAAGTQESRKATPAAPHMGLSYPYYMRFLLWMLVFPLTAQVTPSAKSQITASVTSTAPGSPVSTVAIVTPPVHPRTVLASGSCAWRTDGIAYEVGDSVTCTVALSQQARGDTTVNLLYDSTSGWTGPATVTILNATTSATFTVTAIDVPSPLAELMPWSTWWQGGPTEHIAALTLPCCARADLCRLPLDRVSQEPCSVAP